MTIDLPAVLLAIYLVGLINELRHVPRMARSQFRVFAAIVAAHGKAPLAAAHLVPFMIVLVSVLLWPVTLPASQLFKRQARAVKVAGVRIADVVDAIDIATWQRTPAVRGYVAVEADLAAGKAIFNVTSVAGSLAIDMELPARAYHEGAPVVVIQAEAVQGEAGVMETVGVRHLDGAGMTCLLRDLELVGGGEPWPERDVSR